MSTDLETLARRARLCRYWHFLPGMLVVDTTGTARRLTHDDATWKSTTGRMAGVMPDLSDDDTVDGLRELVNRTYGAKIALNQAAENRWFINLPFGNQRGITPLYPADVIGRSQVDVLVQVLELAEKSGTR